VKYAREYILLPQGLGSEWWAAAERGRHGKENTFGSSPDDAGIGDLDIKNVVVINGHLIGTGLDQSWFDTYYPGTTTEFIDAKTPEELEQKLKGQTPPRPPDNPAKDCFLPTLHLQTEQEGWTEFIEILCQRGMPPYAVKFVGGFESSRKVKAIAANHGVDILTIGRLHEGNQDKYLKAADKTAAATAWLDRHNDIIANNPIDLISDLNETIATDNIESINNAVGLSVALIPICRQRWGGEVGFIALETAVGNPREGQQTEMLVPVAYETVRASEGARVPFFIGYHSYWWGRVNVSTLRAAGIVSRHTYAIQHANGMMERAVGPSVITSPNVLAALKLGNNHLAGRIARQEYDNWFDRQRSLEIVSLASAASLESGLDSWWKWHAGRSLESWASTFKAHDLNPLQIFTEIGVVASPDGGPTLLASEGWRSSICYNADWPFYRDELLHWQDLVKSYDVGTAGTIFTIGDDYVGWGEFKLKEPQMIDLANHARL
jgi:hypothetical protein